MRRRLTLIMVSALMGFAVVPSGDVAAAGGLLNDNPTLRCLVNKQLGADRAAPVSADAAASVEELSGWLPCGTFTTLDGVEELSSLRSLRINDANTFAGADLTPLASLATLEELQISTAGLVTDLSPVSELPNLERLNLGSVHISDFASLAGAPRLRELVLDGGSGIDVSTFADLDQVQSLNIRYMPSLDLTGIDEMAGLTSLEVHYSFLQDLTPLGFATQLTDLTLARNQIFDVSPLASLTALTSLQLNENRIVEIGSLSSLTQLNRLDLSANDIMDLASLAGMTKLRSVNLSQNEIVSVASLRNLTEIQDLRLHINSIQSVAPLAGLTQIRTAEMWSNEISSVAALSSWTGAESVVLNNNRITDLRPLKELTADVRALDQFIRVPDGTTLDRLGPFYNQRAQLCPVTYNYFGEASWSCRDGKFYGRARTISGQIPGPPPVPTPTPTPSVPVKPRPTPPGPVPFPELPFTVYNTPGEHVVNGRRWKTTCEPYSRTWRCRTEIWASTIAQKNGAFVAASGWAFNNLTYLPSPRALWKNNPLGYTGWWTAPDGRQWETACDSLVTGKNGCRSYAWTRIIVNAAAPGTPAQYAWKNVKIFNNMVQFS